MFKLLAERENWIAGQVVDIAVNIHKVWGPAYLKVYMKNAFVMNCIKGVFLLRNKNLRCDELIIGEGLRIDILLDNLVVIELKAQEYYHPVWEVQVLSYLKLSTKRLGFILNFNVSLMKEGIKRMVV